MVCISCIVIPVLLWLWHRFLQPVVLKFYNPWQKIEESKSDGSGGGGLAAANGGKVTAVGNGTHAAHEEPKTPSDEKSKKEN